MRSGTLIACWSHAGPRPRASNRGRPQGDGMHGFEYRAPGQLAEATAILDQYGSEATVLAGGQSLMILLRQGLVSPGILLGIKCVAGLADLRETPMGLRLGAAMTYRAASNDPRVRAQAPVLARAAGSVGSVHIRNMGTVGGSVCHADPAAMSRPCFLSLTPRRRSRPAGGPGRARCRAFSPICSRPSWGRGRFSLP